MKESVPFIVFEDTVIRLERTIKRLWILCIIIFIACVVSNACWIYYESQFGYETTTQTVKQDVDSGDGDLIISGIGDIYGSSTANGN